MGWGRRGTDDALSKEVTETAQIQHIMEPKSQQLQPETRTFRIRFARERKLHLDTHVARLYACRHLAVLTSRTSQLLWYFAVYLGVTNIADFHSFHHTIITLRPDLLRRRLHCSLNDKQAESELFCCTVPASCLRAHQQRSPCRIRKQAFLLYRRS